MWSVHFPQARIVCLSAITVIPCRCDVNCDEMKDVKMLQKTTIQINKRYNITFSMIFNYGGHDFIVDLKWNICI